MISSFPCSSVTENATCKGSSGEFCLVKWTSFTLSVSCSWACTGINSPPRLNCLRFANPKKYAEFAQAQIQSTQEESVDIERWIGGVTKDCFKPGNQPSRTADC